MNENVFTRTNVPRENNETAISKTAIRFCVGDLYLLEGRKRYTSRGERQEDAQR